jgi:hypothetical protein
MKKVKKNSEEKILQIQIQFSFHGERVAKVS